MATDPSAWFVMMLFVVATLFLGSCAVNGGWQMGDRMAANIEAEGED